MAVLVIRSGPGSGSEIPVDGELVLGRDPRSADRVIDDPGVSRGHAAVRDFGGVVTVEDLGSSNGTYANGHRISGEVELTDGDEIRIGGTVLTVRERAGLAPRQPPPVRRQPPGIPGRLDEEGNIPALCAVFLGPLSIFLLVFSSGAAFFVSLPCSIGAIVLGNMGMRRVDRGEADSHRTLANIGRITGIIGTVLSTLALVAWLVIAVALDAAGDNLSDLIDRVNEELDSGTGP